MSSEYRNITISGLPGNGSTTLLRLLQDALKEKGEWKAFSGGEFMRSYAAEKGLFDTSTNTFHHDATVYGEDFDREVDYGMRSKLEHESGWILESWLSGFVAQQVQGVLKVLVMCSSDEIRIDRIVNRDNISIDDAKIHISARTEKNVQKWSRMYKNEWNMWVVEAGTLPADHPIDFWHPNLYDLVIDTYSTNKKETLQKVLHAIKA